MERVKAGQGSGHVVGFVVRVGPATEAGRGGLQQIHGVDLETTLFRGGLEGRGHGEGLEGLDDALGVGLLEARAQLAVRGEVALGGVDVDHQEDAAEQLEQLVEFLEDLLEEQVVGLDHEDRTGGRVAELPGHAVVAELHAAVEAGGVDHDGAGLGELARGQLEIDPADRLGVVDGGVEQGLGVVRLADLLGELAVGAVDGEVQGGRVREGLHGAGVAGDLVLALLRVGDVDHARIGGQAGDLAHVTGRQGVHQGRLATLEGAEDQHIGLLLRDLLGQGLELVRHVPQRGTELAPGEVIGRAVEGAGGLPKGMDQVLDDGVEFFAELAEQGAHGAFPGVCRREVQWI